MRIERHIFGSVDGYRTLAHTPGLTQSDCKALEAFAFGTPYDPAVRASFAARPAYWSRPLGSERRALTLVKLGELDDAGRPTLLFITAVVSRDDWDDVLFGDVTPLLNHKPLWNWTSATPLAPVELPAPDPVFPNHSAVRFETALGIISLIEASWGTRNPIIVRDDQCTLVDIALVERLLPPEIRERFSVVYRALNTEMRTTLVCLADGVPASISNPPRPLQGAVSPYARRLVQAGILEGRDPGRIVRTYNSFAQTEIEPDYDALKENSMRASIAEPPARRAAGVATLLAVALVAFAAGAATGWRIRRPAPAAANPWPAALTRFLQVPLTNPAEQASALQDLSDEFSSNAATLSLEVADPLRVALAERNEDARLVQAADAAIAAASPNDKPSRDAADKAIHALESRGPTVAAAPARRWAEQRSRLAPQPDRLSRVMTELYSEIRALSAPAKRPTTPEAEADGAADAQSLMAAITVNARVDPTLRDAGFDEAIASLTSFVKRQKATPPLPNSGVSSPAEVDKQIAALVNAIAAPATTQPDNTRQRLIVDACRELAAECQNLDDFRRFEQPLSLLAEAIESGRTPTTTAPFGTITVDITLWPVLERCATATSAMRRTPRPKNALLWFESAMKDLRRVANEKLPPSGPPR